MNDILPFDGPKLVLGFLLPYKPFDCFYFAKYFSFVDCFSFVGCFFVPVFSFLSSLDDFFLSPIYGRVEVGETPSIESWV